MTLTAAVKIELIETALADGKYRTLQKQLKDLKDAGQITTRYSLSNSHELLKAEAQRLIDELRLIAETQAGKSINESAQTRIDSSKTEEAPTAETIKAAAIATEVQGEPTSDEAEIYKAEFEAVIANRSFEAETKIMSEAESQWLAVDTIKVETQELAEKVVARYNLERQIRLNPISLAEALELVQEDMKEESNQDGNKSDKFAQLRSEREQSFAQLQEEAIKELLKDELEQRALLRLNTLSNLMPTLMQQALDHFIKSQGSEKLISIPDLIKDGYEIVDEMISQSGLDDI